MDMLLSKSFHQGLTETFHLINTLRTALAVLVEPVQKLVAAGANDRVIESLYEVPGVGSGQNLRVFTSLPPEEHDRAFAEMWLFAIIGRYEAWSETLPVSGSKRGCQHPSQGVTPLSTKTGYRDVFGALNRSMSMSAVYDQSSMNDPRLLEDARIDDALIVFRLIKEIRNSSAHERGVANERVESWSQLAAAKARDLFVGSAGNLVPLPSFAEGDRAVLSLLEVRAFVSLLLRLVFTIDSKLLCSVEGEREFETRWRARWGERPLKVSKAVSYRRAWLTSRLQGADLPVPDDVLSVRDHLIDGDMVQILL